MSETQETEAVEEPAAVEETAAEATATAVEEPPAQEPAADEAPAAEAEVEAPAPAAGPLQGRVYVCERGHRVAPLWNTPEVCRAKVTRNSECGRPLYHITELPEQVQKALNPLKASKKASKKG